MKYECKILIPLFIVTSSLPAQAPDTLWTRTYGGSDQEMVYSIVETVDDGFIIAGYTHSFGAGGSDMYLIKVDSTGALLWQKTYGGIAEDRAWAVRQTADEGYVIGGLTYSYGAGGSDMYLVRTDCDGDTLWTKTYGGTGHDECHALEVTPENGFLLVGRTALLRQECDVYIVKTDSMGTVEWERTYGGESFDIAYSVSHARDAGYTIAGHSISFGGSDAYVIRINAQGDSLWTRVYGGSGHDLASHVEPTSDSCHIIAGYTESFGAMYGDYLLVKFNDAGDTVWTRNYGGKFTEWAYAVREIRDQQYITTGWTDSYGGSYGGNIYLVKFDGLGDTVWTTVFAGDSNDAAFDMLVDDNDCYIIAGCTNSQGAGGFDVYLIKTAPDTPGIVEQQYTSKTQYKYPATILTGSLQLHTDKPFKIFDITGRQIHTFDPAPGIYFIEVDGEIRQKVIKIR